MLKKISRSSTLTFLGGLISANAMAGTVTYVPIASDITFFVPVAKVECLTEDVCITWTTKAIDSISSGFTDDPEFNYSDDTNKRHQINTLYYNSQNSDPIRLQCLTGSGVWADVVSSGQSAYSVINSIDSIGQPLNLNYGALQYPVYQHKWPGALLVNATNCQATTTNLSVPTSDAYTYTHTQKSFTLRMVNPVGTVAYVLPPALDSYRLNNGAPNLWQRTLDSVGSSRPTSIQLAVDEQVGRVSNYGTVSASFGSTLDQFACNWYLFIDNVPQRVNGQGVQQVYGRDGGSVPSTKVRKGLRTIKFDRNGLLCYSTGRICNTPLECVNDSIHINASGATGQSNQTNSATKTFQIEVK